METANGDEAFFIPPRFSQPSLVFGCSVDQAEPSFPSAASPSSHQQHSSLPASSQASEHSAQQPEASVSTSHPAAAERISSSSGASASGSDQHEHAALASLVQLYREQDYILAWQGGKGAVLLRQGYHHPRILQCIWQVRCNTACMLAACYMHSRCAQPAQGLFWQGGKGAMLMRQAYHHPRILQCIWQVTHIRASTE